MARVFKNDVRALLGVTGQSPKLLRHQRSRVFLGKSCLPVCASTTSARHVRLSTVRPASDEACRRRYNQLATNHVSSQSASEDVLEANADGAPVSPLVIVFTDIVKSTVLWEKDTASMDEAMTIHDNLVRDLAAKYNGYEVKQNGDGFMYAFQSPTSALGFCLDMQMQLQEQEWPQELLELGPAKPVVGDIVKHESEQPQQEEKIVLWKGLRLRISAHYGEAVCRWNEVIGRMDYLGPTVNRAARYISMCEAGQIVISREFLEELKQARKDPADGAGPLFDGVQTKDAIQQELDLQELKSDDEITDIGDTRFEVRFLGERHFKGITEDQQLFFILPKSLHGRLDFLPKNKYVQGSKGNLIENG